MSAGMARGCSLRIAFSMDVIALTMVDGTSERSVMGVAFSW